jgi:hypothetical protein
MSLVCPNSGEILLLQYITGLVVAGNPVIHLYGTNTTVDNNTVIGDLVEVTSAGYAPITLTSSNWTTTQTSGVTSAVYSEQTFAFTTDAQAYGYYVTDSSGALLWLEEFSGAPFAVPSGGGSISITAKLTLS